MPVDTSRIVEYIPNANSGLVLMRPRIESRQIVDVVQDVIVGWKVLNGYSALPVTISLNPNMNSSFVIFNQMDESWYDPTKLYYGKGREAVRPYFQAALSKIGIIEKQEAAPLYREMCI